ncbi:MAG: hypothetical protein GJ676_09785 [Rhodobacteraceae bacterium]|nr:hypothetical protein [Paracoccaceae bacterium]
MEHILRIFRPTFLTIILAALIQMTNLTTMLGAHPWWADKVVWLGVPVGLCLAATAWVLRLSRTTQMLGFGLATCVAFGLTQLGKARFAASYAEDMLAGQIWYLGWIATCALAFATLASLTAVSHQTR